MRQKLNILLFFILFATQLGTFIYMMNSNSRDGLYYIDSIRLLDEYKGMQNARKEYRGKSAQWQSNLDTLSTELERLVTEHQVKLTEMSSKERELSDQLIQSKQKELMTYRDAIRTKASDADKEMTNRVLAEVNEFIKQYGKDRKMNIILAATSAGNIVYADSEKDLTDDLIEELNKNYLGE